MMMMHNSDCAGRRTKAEVEAVVLGCLSQSKVPLGAYEIIEHAAAVGSRLIPAQVYRTLGRLVDRRRVHRVASLSGYIVIDGPVDCLSICTNCRRVFGVAAPYLLDTLLTLGSSTGFRGFSTIVEVPGTCSACRGVRADGSDSDPNPMAVVVAVQ